MAAPLVLWDPAMLRYDFGPTHPLNPIRLELTWRLANGFGVLGDIDTVSPQPATDAELALVHDPAYIAAVRAASIDPTGHGIGHGFETADNPAFAGMHDAAALIAGGSLMAARSIAHREVDKAVNIAGGLHHAMADHASGFCIYNDAALAIATLLEAGVQKVAYVDVDVHHGDGVQRAFYRDPRVLTISIHQAPNTLWPGTGYISESGRGAAAGSAVNIPLPAGTGDDEWLRAFHAVVPSIVHSFQPDVLVTQHGADSHRDDPLADLMLTVDGQLASYLALRDLAEDAADGRWLALGGGGYEVVRVVPRIWTHLLALVTGYDVSPDTQLIPEWLEAARAARPGAALPETMSDLAAPLPPFQRWDGAGGSDVDHVIAAVRKEVFPLHGLDPFDARD